MSRSFSQLIQMETQTHLLRCISDISEFFPLVINDTEQVTPYTLDL